MAWMLVVLFASGGLSGELRQPMPDEATCGRTLATMVRGDDRRLIAAFCAPAHP